MALLNQQLWEAYLDSFAYDLNYLPFSELGGTPFPNVTRGEFIAQRRREREERAAFWREHLEEERACDALQDFCASIRVGLTITRARALAVGAQFDLICLQQESYDYEDHRPGDPEWVLLPRSFTDDILSALASAWRLAHPRYENEKQECFSSWLKRIGVAKRAIRPPRMYEY